MPYRTTHSWREWFFEVFAPNAHIPFEPLPLNEAERKERAERKVSPKDITRLNLDTGDEPAK